MVTRRLAAVLCADVAGFSRLAERDETRTHARLAELRASVLDPAIAAQGGRTVETMGDGLLVEFASATAAVRCAVDIQRAMAGRNDRVPHDDRMVLRIGINLGDVIVDGDDIFGDGVNVAARLEALADPGAIAVSATLWEHVREDVGADVTDGGEVHVKSIERPIHVFHLVPRLQRGKGTLRLKAWRRVLAPPWRSVAAAAAAVVVGVALVAAYRMASTDTPSRAATATAAPPRSMVFLPFAAVGADADGDAGAQAAVLSAEFARLLTAGMRDWRVAEPPAAPAGDVRAIARAANVRYVVAGDLQHLAGERSLTVRVIDGAGANRIVTEQRSLPASGDRAGQAAVIGDLARVVRVALAQEEARRERPPERPKTAAEYLARARASTGAASAANAQPIHDALRDLDEALKLDPSLTEAWIRKAEVLWLLRGFAFTEDVDPAAIAQAMDEASLRAVELDPRDPRAWSARMTALEVLGRWDAAFDASDRAMQLDPADAWLVQERALLLIFVGRPEEALRFVEERRARDPSLGRYTRFVECRVLLTTGRYREAIPVCERNASGSFYIEQMFLTALYANVGDTERARTAKARIMELAPGFTISKWRSRAPSHPDFVRQFDEHILPGLRKAGVPE
jgi:class 3 adenylate cyclase